jgi:hypothetical protein
VLEMHGHAGPPRGHVEQGLVELVPRDRIDQFVGAQAVVPSSSPAAR